MSKPLTLAQRQKYLKAIQGRVAQMKADFSQEIESGKFVRIAVKQIVEEMAFLVGEIARLKNRVREVEEEDAQEEEAPEEDAGQKTTIPAATGK